MRILVRVVRDIDTRGDLVQTPPLRRREPGRGPFAEAEGGEKAQDPVPQVEGRVPVLVGSHGRRAVPGAVTAE